MGTPPRNPRAAENLAPAWQPGQSGNPKGRPPRKWLEERWQKQLKQGVRLKDGKRSKEKAVDLVFDAQLKAAVGQRKTEAAKFIFGYAYGGISQPLTGADGQSPITASLNLESLPNDRLEQLLALADKLNPLLAALADEPGGAAPVAPGTAEPSPGPEESAGEAQAGLVRTP